MFRAGSAPEVGGVVQRDRIGVQQHQVEITAIGGGLESVRSERQVRRGAGAGVGHVMVHGATPTAEVDLTAVAYQEGRR